MGMAVSEFDHLDMRELRTLSKSLRETVYKYRDLSGLLKLAQQVQSRLEADPRYIKGKVMREKAWAKGNLEDGYADAEDYYFAVTTHKVTDRSTKKESQFVELLLCFKWNWWMNGESYVPHEDGEGRNFCDFLTKEMRKRWEREEQYTETEEELRKHLLAKGFEEMPQMVPIYQAYCEAINHKRQNLDEIFET